jgi:hypothetical protein
MNAPVAITARKKNERSVPTNSPSEVRTAYPYFHEKREKNAAGVPFTYSAGHAKAGQPNPRYSATIMFPKLNADAYQCANYMFLWGHAVEAAKKMWPQNVDAQGQWVWPAGAQLAIKDGDVPFQSKPKPGQPLPSAEEVAKKNAWRRGYWIVEVEHFLDPGPRIAKVLNGTEQELSTKTINGVVQYKSGDFGVVNIHSYAYENSTFGVSYGFDGFCFTREGELIGNNSGPRSVGQMFSGVAGMVPQSAPVAPGAVAPGPAPLPPAAPAPTYASPVAPVAPPAPTYAAPPPAPPMPPAAVGLPPLPVR